MSTLKAHNIEPATGTDVALGAAGDSITVSGDSLKLNTFKDAGGNTLFTSNGSGTLSSINTGLTPGPILIQSQTANNSASISFTSGLTSTYDKYMFVFVNINPATNNVHFQFNGSTDSGSNYNATKTTTVWHAYNGESAGTSLGYDVSYDLAQSTSDQLLMPGIGNGADECAAGELHLFNPSSTTYAKHFYATTNSHFHSNYSHQSFIGGYFNTTSAIDAVQFKMASGNFDGTIKMWGVK